MNHADILEPVERELNSKGREQEPEHLLRDKHPALIQVVADPVGPTEDRDIDCEHEREQQEDDGDV
jgi:hypothetical protein